MSIQLPALEQNIDIDTGSLARAIAMAKEFGRVMDDSLGNRSAQGLEQDLAGVRDNLRETGREADRAQNELSQLGRGMEGLRERIRFARVDINHLGDDLRRLRTSTRGVTDGLRSITNGLGELGRAAAGAKTAFGQLNNNLRDLARRTGEANDGLSTLAKNIQKVASDSERADGHLRDLGQRMSSLGRSSRDSIDDLDVLGNRIDEAGDESRQAGIDFEELIHAVDRVGHQVSQTNAELRGLANGIDNVGHQTESTVVAIHALADAIDDMGDEAQAAKEEARGAGRAIDNLGDQARSSIPGVLGLAGSLAALSGTNLILKLMTSFGTLATGLSATGAAMATVGAVMEQMGLAGIGLVAALAPVASLALAIPAALAGIGAVGATVMMAWKEGNAELDQAKKNFTSLGEEITHAVQDVASPAIAHLLNTIVGMKPVLIEGFQGIATSVATVADQLNEFVGSTSFQDDFKALMASAGIQAEDWGSLAVNAVKGFTDIAMAGIPIAEKFSDKIRLLGERFQKWAAEGRASGSIAAMLQEGYDVAGRLFGMVGNLLHGFGSLASLTKQLGLSDTILRSLEQASVSFSNFGTTYRNELVAPIQNANKLIEQLGVNIKHGRGLMLELFQIDATPLLKALVPIEDMLGGVARSLAEGGISGLPKILKAIGDQRGAIQNIADVLGGFLDNIGDFGAKIIPNIAGPLQQLTVQVTTFATDIGDIAANLLPNLTGPLIEIVGAVRQMVTNVAREAAPIVQTLVNPVKDAVITITRTLDDTARGLAGPIKAIMANVVPVLSGAISDLVPKIGELVVKIGELIAAFAPNIASTISGIATALGAIASAATTFADGAKGVPDLIKNIAVAFGALLILKKLNIFGVGGLISTAGAAPHLGVIRRFTTDVGNAFRGMTTSTAGHVAGFRSVLGGVGTAVGGLVTGSMRSLVAFLGGPWGIALMGGMVVLGLFAKANAEAAQKEAEHKAQLEALKDTLDQVTGAVTALTRKKIGENLVDRGLIDDIAKLGGTTGEAIQAIAAGGEELDAFKEKMVTNFTAMVNSNQDLVDELQNSNAGSWLVRMGDEAGFSLDKLARAWAGGTDSYNAYADEVAAKTGRTSDQVRESFEAIGGAIDQHLNGAAGSFRSFGDQMAMVGVGADQIKQAFRDMSDSAYEAAGKFGPIKVSAEELHAALLKAHDEGRPVAEVLTEMGLTAQQAAAVIATFGDDIDGTTGKFTGMGNAAKQAHDAMKLVVDIANQGIPGATELSKSFETMASNLSTAADKAQAMADALDILNGGTKSVEDAQFDLAGALDSTRESITGIVEENPDFVAGLMASNGALDANNKTHRAFRDTISGLTDDYNMVLTSQYESTKASKGQAAAMEEAKTTAIAQRQSFIDLMGQYGITGQAAETLADKVGLIPEQRTMLLGLDGTDTLVTAQLAGVMAQLAAVPDKAIIKMDTEISPGAIEKLREAGHIVREGLHGEIRISSKGVDTAGAEIDDLVAKVHGMPTGKMEVDPPSPEAQQALIDLGYKIETLPSGQVSITDDTASTKLNLDQVVEKINKVDSTPGTVTIYSQQTTDEALSRLQVLGYTVEHLPNGQVKVTDNTPETKNNIQGVYQRLVELPPNTPVTISAETAAAMGNLDATRYTIVTMPDGSVTITATATGIDYAESALNNVARSRTSNIYLNYIGSPPARAIGGMVVAAEGGLFAPMAHGGLVSAFGREFARTLPKFIPMAHGDLYDRARRSPMSARHAVIVPPNTPRLIGDNMTKRELFVPLDPANPRSIALMLAGAREMGLEFVGRRRQRVLPMAEGGMADLMGKLRMSNLDFVGRLAYFVRDDRPVPRGAAPARREPEKPTRNVAFTFNQYNPQTVPQSVMVNQALQLVAAAGLL